MSATARKIGLAMVAALAMGSAAFASVTATLTVTGSETQRFDQSWDIGPMQVTVNTSNNISYVETVYYGQYSTPASVASQIAGQFSRDYLQSGMCANASGATVTFKLRGAGAAFGMLTVSGPGSSFLLNSSGFASYNWTPPPSSGINTMVSTVYMTGGVDAGTYYDSGTVSVRVSGATASAEWNEGSTPASVASELASAINAAAGGFVSATASGATIAVASLTGGPAADMSIAGSATDTNTDYFSAASFSVATTNMTGGGATEGDLLYGFTIPDQGGYDLNGNLLSVTDSVMGQWNYRYDNLNRLASGEAVLSSAPGVSNPYATSQGVVQALWSYDPFGNRTAENWGGSGSYNVPASTTANFTAATNQLAGTQYTYDAAGDVTYDGLNNYLYDAEGRICAVKNSYGLITGYIYDAAGIRVAKGSLAWTGSGSATWSTACSGIVGQGGWTFTTTTSWVLGPGGEQVTEYSVANGQSNWVHTNAFAGGALLATYTSPLPPNGSYPGAPAGDTIFDLQDWLGTKRAEVSAGGCFSWFTSMPYGDGLTPNGTCADATEHHFTGKERDAESGNDYFDARYYSSAMGRFMSPDWSAQVEPVPYAKLDNPQSLNLYSYVLNNPLILEDNDGHEILYAAGLKNEQEVRDTVQAILANPHTSGNLSGYVGPNSPNLTIQSGDLSGGDSRTVSPDGQTVTTTTVQGNTAPDIQSSTITDNNGVSTSETTLTGATITIDNRTSTGDLPGVMVHESVHAGEAKADPAKFSKDAKSEAGKPHDQRPQEERANAAQKAYGPDIKKAVKQIEKDRKKENQ
jgi:RHS repeat-associated protein